MTICLHCHQDTHAHLAGCAQSPRPFVRDNRHAAKRLPVDDQGRKICRCGLAPVAYRSKCKACHSAYVRQRRAAKAAAEAKRISAKSKKLPVTFRDRAKAGPGGR